MNKKKLLIVLGIAAVYILCFIVSFSMIKGLGRDEKAFTLIYENTDNVKGLFSKEDLGDYKVATKGVGDFLIVRVCEEKNNNSPFMVDHFMEKLKSENEIVKLPVEPVEKMDYSNSNELLKDIRNLFIMVFIITCLVLAAFAIKTIVQRRYQDYKDKKIEMYFKEYLQKYSTDILIQVNVIVAIVAFSIYGLAKLREIRFFNSIKDFIFYGSMIKSSKIEILKEISESDFLFFKSLQGLGVFWLVFIVLSVILLVVFVHTLNNNKSEEENGKLIL